MYFLPRNSKLYAAIVHTRKSYRYVFTLLFVGVLGYGGYMGVYMPLNSMITMYERAIVQVREQLMRDTKERLAQDARAHSIQELKTKVRSYAQGLSAADAMRTALNALMQQAQHHHCSVTQCRMEQERDKQWYTKQTLALDLQGDLSSLSAFLAKKDPAVLAQCRSVRLAHEGQNNYSLSCGFNCLAPK